MREPESLIQRLLHFAEATPDKDAVVTSAFKLSYEQLAQLVQIQAQNLKDLGVMSDSVIGIKCANDVQHLILCLATTFLGATSCTIPTHESEQTQKSYIEACAATHVIDQYTAIDLTSSQGDAISANLKIADSDSSLLFSTSGTTGQSKLVILHSSDLVAQAHRHIGSAQERFTCLASMEHNFSKRHRLYCLAIGATNIFVDAGQESIVSQCHSLHINVMHVSAYQAQELLAIPNINSLSHIRLKLGGSHVTLPLRKQLRDQITRNLQAGYGTTETGAIGFTDPDDEDSAESVGQPLPGIEIRTVTPQREPLVLGERGELAIRAAGMFRGYLGRPEETADRLENDWFYTGDIGYLDNHQRIHLCGRSDDMFVFNSMNIYPQEIEAKICQHPHIVEAAVIQKTSTVHGSIPVALVVYSKAVKPKLTALKKFVRDLVGIRCPRQFIVVTAIPRNASGKISRQAATQLSTKSDNVRHSIIQALDDANVIAHIAPKLLTAFKNGDKDISLREIGMDSLARMELLVMLETHHDAIVSPQTLSRCRRLGDIVAQVLSPSLANSVEQDSNRPVTEIDTVAYQTDDQPYIMRFFRRLLSLCHTAVQLNKALATLEQRLTPTQFVYLYEQHSKNQLIPASIAPKLQNTLTHWLEGMQELIRDSGKQSPEQFVARRIAPTAIHFTGVKATSDKSLLICFATRGGQELMMPNTILMQHTDSTQYDLLMISEPLGESYRLGVPFLGNKVTKVVRWIASQDFIKNYNNIRTIGCSAGGYPAIIAGYLLHADIALSVGCRFHRPKEHPMWVLDRVINIGWASYRGRCPQVLLSFAADKKRDRKFARTISRLFGGNMIEMNFNDEKVGHRILERLAERGELAAFLKQTIFADRAEEATASQHAKVC